MSETVESMIQRYYDNCLHPEDMAKTIVEQQAEIAEKDAEILKLSYKLTEVRRILGQRFTDTRDPITILERLANALQEVSVVLKDD